MMKMMILVMWWKQFFHYMMELFVISPSCQGQDLVSLCQEEQGTVRCT